MRSLSRSRKLSLLVFTAVLLLMPGYFSLPSAAAPNLNDAKPQYTAKNDALTLLGADSPQACTPAPWDQGAAYPLRVRGVSVVGVGSYVYAFGGYDGNNHNQAYRFDLTSFDWPAMASATDSFSYAVAVSGNNGKIYVLGGRGDAADSGKRVRIYTIASNSWSLGAPMPDARSEMAAGFYNGKIYVAGGRNDNTQQQTWAYDIASNTWATNLPSMLDGVQGGAFAVIDGTLYVAGGYFYRTSLFAYDIANRTWLRRASLPVGMQYAAGAALDGKFWVYGGQGSNGNKSYVYDPLADEWTNGENLSVYYEDVNGATLGNKVVLVGGSNGNGYINNVELGSFGDSCPHPTATATATLTPGVGPSPWQQGAQYPLRVRGVSEAGVGNLLYAFGGYDGNNHNQAYRYDPSTFTWTALAAATDSFSYAVAVSGNNGKIYVLGGRGDAADSGKRVRIYTIASNSWSLGAPMPDARSEMAAGFYNGKIYVAGGRNDNTQQQTWAYDMLV